MWVPTLGLGEHTPHELEHSRYPLAGVSRGLSMMGLTKVTCCHQPKASLLQGTSSPASESLCLHGPESSSFGADPQGTTTPICHAKHKPFRSQRDAMCWCNALALKTSHVRPSLGLNRSHIRYSATDSDFGQINLECLWNRAKSNVHVLVSWGSLAEVWTATLHHWTWTAVTWCLPQLKSSSTQPTVPITLSHSWVKWDLVVVGRRQGLGIIFLFGLLRKWSYTQWTICSVPSLV